MRRKPAWTGMNALTLGGALALLSLLPGVSAAAVTSERAAEAHLLILSNGKVVVGLLPRVGGRVVLLRRPGGANVLLSDPALWDGKNVPGLAPGGEFKFYFGHTTWLGPQSRWWSQQTKDPARRGQTWPPDPYWEFAAYRVVHRDALHAVLQGPSDPISGLRLTKDVRILPSGVVHVRVTATNERDRPVSWEIWPNTRVPADAGLFIPVAGGRDARVPPAGSVPPDTQAMPFTVQGGFFSFRNDVAFPPGVNTLSAKAFLRPSRGVEAAFVGSDLFLKRSALVPPAKESPDEAFAEVYSSRSRGTGLNVMEMEMQGALQTFAPGQSATFDESWQVMPYRGAPTRAARLAFLKRLGM